VGVGGGGLWFGVWGVGPKPPTPKPPIPNPQSPIVLQLFINKFTLYNNINYLL